MNFSDLASQPHRRLNPLTREWVLVSPYRTQRPWQGQVEKRACRDDSGLTIPIVTCAPAMLEPAESEILLTAKPLSLTMILRWRQTDTASGEIQENRLLVAQGEAGRCRVVCFSPRHDLTMARMTVRELRRVVDVWAREFSTLANDTYINAVQIFENRRHDDGMQQSSSAWSNLGQSDRARRAGERIIGISRLSSIARHYAAARLSGVGAAETRATCLRERPFCVTRPLLGGLAIRNFAYQSQSSVGSR